MDILCFLSSPTCVLSSYIAVHAAGSNESLVPFKTSLLLPRKLAKEEPEPGKKAY